MSSAAATVPSSKFRTITAVRRAHVVKGASDRAVLYALAAHADGPTGQGAWPRHALLAAEAGVSRSTVQKTLDRLEHAGWIRRGDQSRAPARPGRPLVVWDVALDVLEDAAAACVCTACVEPDVEDTGAQEPVTADTPDPQKPDSEAFECPTVRHLNARESGIEGLSLGHELPGTTHVTLNGTRAATTVAEARRAAQVVGGAGEGGSLALVTSADAPATDDSDEERWLAGQAADQRPARLAAVDGPRAPLDEPQAAKQRAHGWKGPCGAHHGRPWECTRDCAA